MLGITAKHNDSLNKTSTKSTNIGPCIQYPPLSSQLSQAKSYPVIKKNITGTSLYLRPLPEEKKIPPILHL